MFLCFILCYLSTSLVVFPDFSVQLWNSASLLLAAIHCPMPILDTCPKHVSLRCVILSANVLSWCRVLRTVSFFIQSRLVTRNNLLSHVISTTRILCSSFFLRQQHSELYSTIGTTKVLWVPLFANTVDTLVIFEIFFKLNNTKTIKLASTAWATGLPIWRYQIVPKTVISAIWKTSKNWYVQIADLIVSPCICIFPGEHFRIPTIPTCTSV